MIGQKLTDHPQTNMTHLLNHLGLQANRHTKEFVQLLIQLRIPFEPGDLQHIWPLLHMAKDKSKAHHVLVHMLANQLPITRQVFSALYMKDSHELSSLLKDILEGIINHKQQTQEEQQLLRHLQTMSGRQEIETMSFIRNLYKQAINNPHVNHLLKGIQVLTKEATVTNLTRYLSMTNDPASNLTQLKGDDIRQAISLLIYEQSRLTHAARSLLLKWENELTKHLNSNTPLKKQSYSYFQQALMKQLVPIFSRPHQDAFVQQMDNHPEFLRHLLDALFLLTEEKTYRDLENILTKSENPQKTAFLHMINRMLSITGLNYEHVLAHDPLHLEPPTIKQLILHLIEDQTTMLNKGRLQQLLHVLNGIQLQSVEETNHFIYVNLMLPGEKLALNNDIYLQFQSKKTKKQEINPDHCRILFYLTLNNLKDTVIDMHIQKRVVALTVFNNIPMLKCMIAPFESVLKERLSAINYQLTSINFKPLHKQQHDDTLKHYGRPNNFEGVDFRV